ncbi:NADH oxidoreductase, partial [Mesorhizobium sp. M2A.F.Ca.ET.040.01.1.1]
IRDSFWLAEWMRQFRDRLGPAVLEAEKRFSDGRWSTDVTAVVPLDEAMARLPAELAKPNGKVFIRP